MLADLFPVNAMPMPPQDLIGRDAFMRDIVRRVLAGQSILIPGPRRIGKTAVALDLLRRLKEEHQALVGAVDPL